MSNLTKPNQNVPAKQSSISSQLTLGVVGNFIYDNVVKGGLPAAISILTARLAYLRGLDWFWIIISSVVVFFLVAVSLNLIDFRRRKKTSDVLSTENPLLNADLQQNEYRQKDELLSKYEDEIQSLLNKADELEINHQKELESLKKEHQTEIENLKSGFQQTLHNVKQNHKSDIGMREVLLDEVSFLIDVVREQKQNINDYVFLDRFFFNRIVETNIPTIIFTFRIFNKSVFDVTLENEIEGNVEFQGQILLGGKRFYQPPDIISRASFSWLTFGYRLNTEEYEFIKGKNEKNEIKASDFYISKLVLTVKGTDKFSFVEPKQIRIELYLKVLNYEDYNKALKPFSDI